MTAMHEPTGMATGEQDPRDDMCLDVAVIGAGIGGCYTSWKLRNRGLRISIFEYSDRVGGRILTTKLPAAPGTILEFGAMRFLDDHHILASTAKQLKLKIVPLNQGNVDETLWYLRNTHMRINDLGTSRMPYNLDPEERNDPDTLLRKLYNDNINTSLTQRPSREEMDSLTTKDGTPLHEISCNNFMTEFACQEAYSYLKYSGEKGCMLGEHSSLIPLMIYMSYPGDEPRQYRTIEGGMNQVPDTLMEEFIDSSEKHKLHLNHQLMRIERRRSGGYNLRLKKTQTKDGVTSSAQDNDDEVIVVAKKVILAVQPECIKHMDIPIFKNNETIRDAFNSIVGYQAGKIFLAYNSKWWKTDNEITHTRTDLPNRQTYDWQTGSNNVSIIMASYHDGEVTRLWRELSRFGSPIPGSLPGAYAVTDVVRKRLEKYLGQIYNIKHEDIPPAVGGGMMLFESYPFSYACDFFRPGVDKAAIRSSILKPSSDDDIFIVSNSWAPEGLSMWIEGCLLAADELLTKYFK